LLPYLEEVVNGNKREVIEETVVPVWTGITLFEQAGRKSPPAYVERVKRKSPGRTLGLRIDDLIVRIDDFSVRSCMELRTVLKKFKPGDTIKVTWKRGTRVLSGDMTLAEEPKK
jgi:S1-C subfamily serine protease